VPGRYDITVKYLVEAYPAAWVAYLGLDPTAGPIDVIDANLSAVSAEVDKVIRVGAPNSCLLHLEFQSSYDASMGRRMLRYNAMLHHDENTPVASVLVLLRRQADGPATAGAYQIALPNGTPYLGFTYAVRRLWQESPADLLTGNLGIVPLAPLSAVGRADLPWLLKEMDERYNREAPDAEAGRLRVVTYTLLGLRYPTSVIDQLMPGLQHMRDSVTYQAILDEGRVEGRAEGRAAGRVEEAREMLLELGSRRLGAPDARVHASLTAIDDHARLRRLASRLLDVASWDELLALP
jgi:predicted transposase YdaD